jgi:hypothetical protein
MSNSNVWFVYVMMLGKACPQKWNGLKFHEETNKPVPVAFSRQLEEQERNLTIRELCDKYPFEPHKEIENVEIKLD